mmetsp:Transcript_10004/g.19280  ORF Transcript_10004/g.19280 Transcript_10004/m.19280 type:complete len:123 (+) Transcript_10004:171-539(+)
MLGPQTRPQQQQPTAASSRSNKIQKQCAGTFHLPSSMADDPDSRCNAPGSWSYGSILRKAGWLEPGVKSARRSSAAMAERGAGSLVQISHCAQPCSNSISIPSIISQPAANAWATKAVRRGM